MKKARNTSKTSRKAAPTSRKAAPAAEKAQFVVSIDAELIKDLKRAAIDEDTTAAALFEKAVAEFLRSRRSGGHAKGDRPDADRRQFFTTMDVELLKKLKLFAMDRRVSAWSLAEEAVAAWVGRQRGPVRKVPG